jgi:hypothetical protein
MGASREKLVSIIERELEKRGQSPEIRRDIYDDLRARVARSSRNEDGTRDAGRFAALTQSLNAAINEIEGRFPHSGADGPPAGGISVLAATSRQADTRLATLLWVAGFATAFAGVCDFLKPFLDAVVGSNVLAIYVLTGFVASIGTWFATRFHLLPRSGPVIAFGSLTGGVAMASAMCLSLGLVVPGAAAGGIVAQIIPNGEAYQQVVLERLGNLEAAVARIDDRTVAIQQQTTRIEEKTDLVSQGTEAIRVGTEQISRDVGDIRTLIDSNRLKPLALWEAWSDKSRDGLQFNYTVGSNSDTDTYELEQVRLKVDLTGGGTQTFGLDDRRIGPGGSVNAVGLPLQAPAESLELCMVYAVPALGKRFRDRRTHLPVNWSNDYVVSFQAGAPELEEVGPNADCG